MPHAGKSAPRAWEREIALAAFAGTYDTPAGLLRGLKAQECTGEPAHASKVNVTLSLGKEPNMSISAVEADLQERFEQLKADWQSQSRYLSNSAQMAMLWPYQQIIGMGPAVVPLILAELERRTDHWFWALEAITGENPVPEEAAGNVGEMARAWIDWGRRKGLVADDTP